MARPAGDQLLLLRGQTATYLPVRAATAQALDVGSMTLPREDVAEYLLRDGGRIFVARADLPALVEAERVRALEHNAVLRAVFAGGPERGAGPGMLGWVQIAMLAFILIRVLGKG